MYFSFINLSKLTCKMMVFITLYCTCIIVLARIYPFPIISPHPPPSFPRSTCYSQISLFKQFSTRHLNRETASEALKDIPGSASRGPIALARYSVGPVSYGARAIQGLRRRRPRIPSCPNHSRGHLVSKNEL